MPKKSTNVRIILAATRLLGAVAPGLAETRGDHDYGRDLRIRQLLHGLQHLLSGQEDDAEVRGHRERGDGFVDRQPQEFSTCGIDGKQFPLVPCLNNIGQNDMSEFTRMSRRAYDGDGDRIE